MWNSQRADMFHATLDAVQEAWPDSSFSDESIEEEDFAVAATTTGADSDTTADDEDEEDDVFVSCGPPAPGSLSARGSLSRLGVIRNRPSSVQPASPPALVDGSSATASTSAKANSATSHGVRMVDSPSDVADLVEVNNNHELIYVVGTHFSIYDSCIFRSCTTAQRC